jgi:hypothetical protein
VQHQGKKYMKQGNKYVVFLIKHLNQYFNMPVILNTDISENASHNIVQFERHPLPEQSGASWAAYSYADRELTVCLTHLE